VLGCTGVSVEFLTDAQAGAFGRFAGPPSREQLERYFFLDDSNLGLVAGRRRDHNRLGFSLQMTVDGLGVRLVGFSGTALGACQVPGRRRRGGLGDGLPAGGLPLRVLQSGRL